MRAQASAELLKLRSTRTTLGLLLATIGLALLITLLTGLLSKVPSLTGVDNQRNLLSIGGIAGVLSALAGALLMTGEFRFGTIRPTFLFTPQRSRVIGAKYLAGLLTGLVFGVVGEALSLGVGASILAGRGIAFDLSGGQVALLFLGTLAGTALYGVIGVAVGGIVRNQVAVIVGLLAWIFIVESLLSGLEPSVGRYTPSQAGQALAGLSAGHALSAAAGGAVLVAWTVALAVAGVVLVAKRDVG